MDSRHAVAVRRGTTGVLGGLVLAGRVDGGKGITPRQARVFSRYALTLVLTGAGRYRDRQQDVDLSAGSLVLVTPGRPHWYGVTGGGTWDEVYLIFEGPLFDLAAEQGVIVAGTSPPLAQPHGWGRRLDQFRLRRPPTSSAARDREALDLLRTVIELRAASAVQRVDQHTAAAAHGPAGPDGPRSGDWFARSQQQLEQNLAERVRPVEVAAAVGMPYETWRRHFRHRAGVAPAQYRLQHRVDAACTMLTTTALAGRDIAAALGFSDEHHLARHVRRQTGLSPRAYRSQT